MDLCLLDGRMFKDDLTVVATSDSKVVYKKDTSTLFTTNWELLAMEWNESHEKMNKILSGKGRGDVLVGLCGVSGNVIVVDTNTNTIYLYSSRGIKDQYLFCFPLQLIAVPLPHKT